MAYEMWDCYQFKFQILVVFVVEWAVRPCGCELGPLTLLPTHYLAFTGPVFSLG